ncbi:hypothetical protein BPAE_0081g00370 [Botrytis paeoniae]|uniref:Uncharacterized protein n=1 Tax=Botrytis paeoniae TaxID=278948 RepID=A0A4Z1FSZ2_9HELO|nr:hypothetical protein BPAE_0081g00370 [Botrytis paeoniae]
MCMCLIDFGLVSSVQGKTAKKTRTNRDSGPETGDSDLCMNPVFGNSDVGTGSSGVSQPISQRSIEALDTDDVHIVMEIRNHEDEKVSGRKIIMVNIARLEAKDETEQEKNGNWLKPYKREREKVEMIG